MCFRIARFDDVLISEHLEKHGIDRGEIEFRYGAEGYGPSIYLNDPEGNTVELKGPPSFHSDETAW